MYGCNNPFPDNAQIIAIPVYGQSLALGEEAKLITNFDSLKIKYNHRILTENLDENFGFFSNTVIKQRIKKLLHDKHRTFEISNYGMGEYIASYWSKRSDENNYLCSFPEGQGASGIDLLLKGVEPYQKLLYEIKNAYQISKSNHCTFIVPAFCWLQGENDVVWNTAKDYKKKLIGFRNNFEKDVKAITHQKEHVKCILYQTNCLSIAKDTFRMQDYICHQTSVPEIQMELVRDNNNFIASGPTYPYSVVREYVHLDGTSQKRLGYLEGIALADLFENKRHIGLTPKMITEHDDTVIVSLNIQYPPLVIDTVQVAKIADYGFSVITPDNNNILRNTYIKENNVYLICSGSPKKAKIRYAVNGTYWKSGKENGPRGNIRDSQGDIYKCDINNKIYRLDNWCYMFDLVCKN